MKFKTLLCLTLVLSGSLFASEPAIKSRPQKLASAWEYITFPYLVVDGKSLPMFLAGDGENPSQASRGFKFQIMGIPPDFFKSNLISARLYHPNGTVVEPTLEGKETLNSPVQVSTFSVANETVPAQVLTYFPWGTNALEESWIEVSMGTERYWVEIPYGFDRNPADPLPSSFPGGPPKFVSAMKSLTGHDHVMRWQTVQYDLGVIQNGWRLSLIQSNSVDAVSDVVLYREDVKIGTATSWETNSPATALRVLDTSGKIIGSHCTDVHIQDGGMERCNKYVIARNGDEQRCWGQIEISVADKSYWIVVPSSLYKDTHGHASAN